MVVDGCWWLMDDVAVSGCCWLLVDTAVLLVAGGAAEH